MPSDSITAAVSALRNGELIAYPTEAVFGLGCDPNNASALEKLLNLKQREPNKGLICIASRIEQLYDFINKDTFDMRPEIKQQWPGPVTWVMPTKASLPTLLTGNRNTLAVRVSAHPTVKKLCDAFGGAIVSTSANISGQGPFKNIVELEKQFGNAISAYVAQPLGDANKVTSIFDAITGKQLR